MTDLTLCSQVIFTLNADPPASVSLVLGVQVGHHTEPLQLTLFKLCLSCVCGGQRTDDLRESALSTMWVPRTELRFSGLAASVFTC